MQLHNLLLRLQCHLLSSLLQQYLQIQYINYFPKCNAITFVILCYCILIIFFSWINEKQSVLSLENFGTLSPKWEVSMDSLPSELREYHGRGGARRGGEQQNKDLEVTISQVHMNSWRLKQRARGLQVFVPGPLCLCYRFQFRVIQGS